MSACHFREAHRAGCHRILPSHDRAAQLDAAGTFDAELNSILIHELAHLERRDDWTNLAQKVLRALLFFHPAVWWVERQLSLEREMACDDVVLSRTANPRAYAECLVTVAERSLMRRGLALAQAAVSKMRQTTAARVPNPGRQPLRGHAGVETRTGSGDRGFGSLRRRSGPRSAVGCISRQRASCLGGLGRRPAVVTERSPGTESRRKLS